MNGRLEIEGRQAINAHEREAETKSMLITHPNLEDGNIQDGSAMELINIVYFK